MFLRAIAITANEKLAEKFKGGFVGRFHRETCCITELYQSLLRRKIKTNGIAKVQFVFFDSHENVTIGKDDIKSLLDVIVMPWPFNFDRYSSLGPVEKKRCIAASLFDALRWLASVLGWDKASLENAHKIAQQQEFELVGLLKNSWTSPDSQFRARIYFRFELDAVELFAVLYKNHSSKEIVRKYLGSIVPEIGCLFDILNGGRWRAKNTFELSCRDFRKQKWQVNFSKEMTE